MPLPGFAIILLPLLLLPSTHSQSVGTLQSDATALLAFRDAVDASKLLPWNSNVNNTCSWKGILCSRDTTPRVISVRLPGSGLVGPVPAGTIAKLTELRVLSLRSNRLSGPFPGDLTDCTLLSKLYLQANQFTGSLPRDFTVWPALSQIDLSSNRFIGSIPSFNKLTRLRTLFLYNNSFSGSLPYLNISSLTNFSVANNQLNGSIPKTETFAKFDTQAFAGNDLCGFPLADCIQTAAPVPSPSPTGSVMPYHRKKKLGAGAIIGITIGAAGFVLLIVFICVIMVQRRKGGKQAPKNHTEQTQISSMQVKRDRYHAVRTRTVLQQQDTNRLVFYESKVSMFDLEDLLRASAEVLGKGTIGTAYKAILETGIVVVVKRLRDAAIDRREFEQQMEIIGRLKHRNLVPLIAYYFSKEEKLLVYEYMPMGSLSAFLYGHKGSRQTVLDWQTRIGVVLSVAYGLLHLHEGTSYKLRHGNLTSSNVLLTEDLDGCISDYGLCELISASPPVNKFVGYRAPEIRDVRKATEKADVYSFGVLLLEVLTGKASSTEQAPLDGGIDLPRWVQSIVREEWTAEVFDMELLWYQNVEEEMLQMLQVAMACISVAPSERPTIREVIKMIEDVRKNDLY